jgi:hypothetical protein
VRSDEGHHLSELAVTWIRRSPPLDPAVFPGQVVPATFGAILDALDDADPAPLPSRGIDVTGTIDGSGANAAPRQRSRFAALLDELVEPADHRAVAQAAAAWLTRVADAQDPGGADRPAPPVAAPGAADQPDDRRVRADLRSLRPAFDADIATITAGEAAPGRDATAVRTQLIARLGHIDAVARWGEGPERLRGEAAIWQALASS